MQYFKKIHSSLGRKSLCSIALLSMMVMAQSAHAEEILTANISIKDHRFYPSQIKVPAGKKIKLVVTNLDRTPEEFESDQMRFEKIIPAGGRITVFVNPLPVGRYSFFGEFNLNTAQGVMIAQ
jgi:hypothetical protein